jgi:2'-5' RNA ligase
MAEKLLYALATFDEETSAHVTQLAHILNENGITGRQTPEIPHHITLGCYALDKESETKRLVQEVCAGARSFEVSLAHIGFFGLDVLFLTPIMNEALLGLYRRFHGGITDIGAWTPHVTLLIDGAEAILKALPLAAGHFKPRKARVSGVSLYEIFPARFITACPLC